jgi:hypothetical protein
MSRTDPIYRRAERLLVSCGRWMTSDELIAEIGCTRKSLRPAMVVLLSEDTVLYRLERERACYCVKSDSPPVLDVSAIAPKKAGPPPRTWTLDYVRARCDEIGECWIWNQGVQSKGYPQASIDGKPGQSVRAYVFTHLMGKRGPSTRRQCIATRCGQLRCLSPACLVMRTRSGIMREQWGAGDRRPNMGDNFVKRKLTRAQIDEIHALPSGFNQSEVARRMGVHARTICKVANGESYRRMAPASVFEWRP